MMKIVAIVQARMGSTRLPGKVLMDIQGSPMLHRVVSRLARSERVDEIVVATTDRSEDDAIEARCAGEGWLLMRGSQHDLLDRYYQAALERRADLVVRVTADCPLLDPGIVDHVIDRFTPLLPEVDYASNGIPPRTYPRGLDVEVFTFGALRTAWSEDENAAWREHATPFLYRSGRFRTLPILNDTDLSSLRWTVDTAEDLEFVRQVYAALGGAHFSWTDVLDLLRRCPSMAEINAGVTQKEL